MAVDLGIGVVGLVMPAIAVVRNSEVLDAIHHEGFPVAGCVGGDGLTLHEGFTVPPVDLGIDVAGAVIVGVRNGEIVDAVHHKGFPGSGSAGGDGRAPS